MLRKRISYATVCALVLLGAPCLADDAVKLTNYEDLDSRAAWSPDGSKIAYEWWVTNLGYIYPAVSILSRDGTFLEHATGDGSAPTWSPDGARIAFHSNRDGMADIYVVTLETGAEVKLTDGPIATDPSWSPTGDLIAYEVWYVNGDENDIWAIGPNGEDPHPLIEHPDADLRPAWSPDGSKLAFMSTRSGSAEIWIYDLVEETYLQVTDTPIAENEPTWSSDGTWLAFERGSAASRDIWAVSLVTHQEFQITDDEAVDRNPAWSPTENRLAFTSYRSGNGDIWSITVDIPVPVSTSSWGNLKGRFGTGSTRD